MTVLDCDPNRPIIKWQSRRSSPSQIEVMEATESNIIKTIDEAGSRRQYVFVDLEARQTALYLGPSRADLVLVPIQPNPLDSEEGGRLLD